MKTADFRWEHPVLRDFTQRYPAGTLLFSQGEVGDAMYIVLKGLVQLSAVFEKKEVYISVVESGEFVGEQTLMNEGVYQRMFTATAKTEVTALRLSSQNITLIEKNNPTLMLDLVKGMFTVSSKRLRRANRMVQLLRHTKSTQRLVNLILYFCEKPLRQTPSGSEILITPDTIRFYIDMPDFEIEDCLAELQKQKLLIPQGNDCYKIPDTVALRAFIPALADSLPQIPII
ncbi:MAG: Crp/Fnr family transcriptional regulator [Deltaproteobacteria bacterium]|nr:Crp/Fnr family transcriptional regulator [Deltaproteobacteria bacterium]